MLPRGVTTNFPQKSSKKQNLVWCDPLAYGFLVNLLENLGKISGLPMVTPLLLRCSYAGTGAGPGGALAPPIFGRSVPIPTGGGQITPPHPITTAPPNYFTFRHHCDATIKVASGGKTHLYHPCQSSVPDLFYSKDVVGWLFFDIQSFTYLYVYI